MVDIIKLKELGYDVEQKEVPEDHVNDHLVHHMLKGYRIFNAEYAHILSDHSHSIFGVLDKEAFREHLLKKVANKEKDDVLHCALSIISIHHCKKHHEVNGHGVSYSDNHKIIIDFLKNSGKDKIEELHDRFPAITKELVHSIAPEEHLERLYA